VAGGDEEDQQRDHQPNGECADQSRGDWCVGDGEPSPTTLA
jgi:hypothetical protein